MSPFETHEEVGAARARGRSRGRGGGCLGGQQTPRLGREPRTRPRQVDERDPDGHRDRRHDDRVRQGLEADAAEAAEIAHARDAERERRHDERDDEHEQQAEEDPARRLGDPRHEGGQRRSIGEGKMSRDAEAGARNEPQHHLVGQPATHGARVSVWRRQCAMNGRRRV
jgi:hypothetical protein